MQMQFSMDFITKTKLGVGDKTYPNIEKWLKTCEESEGYKKAVKKTGHKI